MLSAFRRATQGILSILGEDALFRDVTPTKINVQHGVQFASSEGDQAAYRGEMTVDRDIATIDSDLDPRSGDRFTLVGGPTYRLEKLVKDSGTARQFVIIEVPSGP